MDADPRAVAPLGAISQVGGAVVVVLGEDASAAQFVEADLGERNGRFVGEARTRAAGEQGAKHPDEVVAPAGLEVGGELLVVREAGAREVVVEHRAHHVGGTAVRADRGGMRGESDCPLLAAHVDDREVGGPEAGDVGFALAEFGDDRDLDAGQGRVGAQGLHSSDRGRGKRVARHQADRDRGGRGGEKCERERETGDEEGAEGAWHGVVRARSTSRSPRARRAGWRSRRWRCGW
jgi:hypothetical protein